jgi:hypothetical protein
MAVRQNLGEQFGMGLMGLGLLGALGLFGWQTYTWLRTSAWISISVVKALTWLNIPWATSPKDWLGLHQLLDLTPLAIALLVLGVIGLLIAATNE